MATTPRATRFSLAPAGPPPRTVDWGSGAGQADWLGGVGTTGLTAPLEQQRTDLGAYRDVLQDVPGLGMRALSGDAARSQAAAMGQAGAMPIGGGSAASLRQTGLDTGRAKAGFLAETLPGVHLARSEAAQQMGQLAVDEAGHQAHALNQIQTIGERYLEPGKGKYLTEAAYSAALGQLQGLYASAPTRAARDAYGEEINRLLQLAQTSYTAGQGIYEGGML